MMEELSRAQSVVIDVRRHSSCGTTLSRTAGGCAGIALAFGRLRCEAEAVGGVTVLVPLASHPPSRTIGTPTLKGTCTEVAGRGHFLKAQDAERY